MSFYVKILIQFLYCTLAFAGVEQISEKEFRSLATELAPKVNLFREVWARDPEAAFYGGTSRDYLYWLKGMFREALNPEAAKRIAAELRALKNIDVRDFIIGDSDIDVVARRSLDLKAEQFGVRKFDTISTDIFDPEKEAGRNELWQGHAPAEKVRLTKSGIFQAAELGDGLHEIYTGKLSVHFSDPALFAETKYAKAKQNHPILLALRYLRLQAINYYKTYGSGFPRREEMLGGMDAQSRAEVERVISLALNRNELSPYLKNEKFKSCLNGTIQKSFRSYTNPTAALEYMKFFGVDKLPGIYGDDKIEPIYQYVFSRFSDEQRVAKNFHTYGLDPENVFENPAHHFKDGYFYHGTKKEEFFRSMIFQGVLPSSGGSAGAGLYGVPESNKRFAEEWAQASERLLKFPLKPDTKIVDITTGPGKKLWQSYSRKTGHNLETFAEDFGIDIIRYPYHVTAYVVKNSDVLGKAQGVYRQLMGFSELLAKAKDMSLKELLAAFDLSHLTFHEQQIVIEDCGKGLVDKINKATDQNLIFSFLRKISPLSENPVTLPLAKAIFAKLAGVFPSQVKRAEALGVLANWFRYPELHSLLMNHIEGKRISELLKNGPAEVSESLLCDFLYTLSQTHGNLLARFLQDKGGFPELFFNDVNARRQFFDEVVRTEKFKPILSYLARDFLRRNEPFADEKVLVDFLFDVGNPINMSTTSPWGGSVMYMLKTDFAKPDHLNKESLIKFFSRQYDPKYAALLQKLIEADADKLNWVKTLFHFEAHWGRHPELLKPFLRFLDVPGFPGYGTFLSAGMMTDDDWLQHEDLLGKFLERFFLRDQELPGVNRANWAKELSVLKNIWTQAQRGDERKRKLTAAMLYKLLLKNDLWQQDPDFLIQVMKDPHLSLTGFTALLASPDLNKFPKVFMKLTLGGQDDKITQQLAHPGWATQPEAVKFLLEMNHTRALDRVLDQPMWAPYPELLEEYAWRVFKRNEVWGKENLEKLLALSHWRNHPAFQKLKVGDSIPYGHFMKHVFAIHRSEKNILLRGYGSCADFFWGLGQK